MCLAVPGRVLTIDAGDTLLKTGTVDFSGVTKKVNLGFLDSVSIGDFVLIHAGVAISSLTPVEAEKVLRDLDSLVETEPFT